MASEERHVSPDGELVLLVVRGDDGDITIGFEGSEWHTHGDILAGVSGTTVETAVMHFVADLLNDRSIVAIGSYDRSPRHIWVEDGSEEPDVDLDVRRRYWSGGRPTPL